VRGDGPPRRFPIQSDMSLPALPNRPLPLAIYFYGLVTVESLRVSRRVARLATGRNAAGGFFRASLPHNVTEPKMDSR
jgi:hypothetical protein